MNFVKKNDDEVNAERAIALCRSGVNTVQCIIRYGRQSDISCLFVSMFFPSCDDRLS